MKKIYFALIISIITLTTNAQTSCFSFTATNYPSGSGSFTPLVDDFNGDGKKDFAGVSWGSNSLYVYMGNGAGSFTAAAGSPNINGSGPLYGLTCGDFNNDGKKDIVVSSSTFFQLYTGSGTGAFTPSTFVSFGTSGQKLFAVSGDFNADGNLDVSFSNYGTTAINTYTGNGTGSFTITSNVYTMPSPTWGVEKGDFNGDGRVDLLFANNSTGSVNLLLGTITGTFVNSTVATGLNSPAQISVGDFNNDSKMDFVVGSSSASSIWACPGNGNGTFGAPITINTAGMTGVHGVALADINLDGKLDILTNGWNSSNTGAYFGNGAGVFTAGTTNNITLPGVTTQLHLASGDFDNDGKTDFVLSGQGTNVWTVLLNKQISVNGPSSVCGSPITLAASASGSYNWMPGGMTTQSVSVLPASTTIYTVTGLFNGCATTAAKTVSVGAASLSVTSTSSILCAGQTATLTAGGAITYTWNSSSGTSMYVVSPTVTTTYTLAGTTGSCTSSIVFTQSVVICTGIAALKGSNGPAIAIYPNPNAGEFTIASNINMDLSLINELGQTVKTISLSESNNRKVPINDLDNGVYFVMDQNNKAVLRQKVVVAR